MKKLLDAVDAVKSKATFLSFVELLIKDLEMNKAEWENLSLSEYLRAVHSRVEDMDQYYINNQLPVPENVSWQVFADILFAGKIYE